MPAVSETHLSVYCFPLLGMREALTPERLRSRHACARLLSRDMKCQNSEKADRLKKKKKKLLAGQGLTSGDETIAFFRTPFTSPSHVTGSVDALSRFSHTIIRIRLLCIFNGILCNLYRRCDLA